MENFLKHLEYPSGEEPIEGFWKGEAKLGRLPGKSSFYHIYQFRLVIPV